MNKVLKFFLGIYMLSVLIAIPYFNWQFAQNYGFVRWFLFGELVASAQGFVWPFFFATNFFSNESSLEVKNVPLPSYAQKEPQYFNLESVIDDSPREYVDNQYNFAFEYPENWKFEKNFPVLEVGEVRVMIRHPLKPMHMVATVGHLERGITKKEFESSPIRDKTVEAMIDSDFSDA